MSEQKWRSKLGLDSNMAEIECYNNEYAKQELNRLRKLLENKVCADCGLGPTEWASFNLGVFLCIGCGSHHREMGTHNSKPKGGTGTYLWGAEEIQNMTSTGNVQAQQMYASSKDRLNPDVVSEVTFRNYLVDMY